MSNKKKTMILFGILLILTNIIFIPWLSGHMATDSYNIDNLGYQEYNKNYSLIDARFLVALGTTIMNILNIPIQTYSIIILEIAIILSIISILLLVNTIEKWKRPKNLWAEILLIIACYYSIFNFIYIENLYYIECAGMAASILFFILSAKSIVEKGKWWKIKSFIFLCIGLMGYQGTISIFFLTLAMLSMCKGNNAKDIIKNFLEGVIIALISILVNQIEIKVASQILQVQQSRDIKLSNIIGNISFIFENISRVLKNVGYYLPKNIFLIILCIMEVLFLIKIIQQNKQCKDNKNATMIIEQFIIIIVGIGAGFIVSIMNTSGFWSGRIRFSIGALIGFLWIYLWAKTDFAEKKSSLNIIMAIILIYYGIINTFNYVTIMIQQKQVNNLDKQIVLEMQQTVKEYETKQNIDVKKIAIVVERGNTSRAFYPQIGYAGSMVTCSSIKTQWAAAGCYNYYSNSNLETYIPTVEEQQNFLKQNTRYQCIDDILYIAVYMY